MGSEPEVSVIIACFNGAATIGQQLEALATQLDAPAFEVLLVDNNSTDRLREVTQPFESRLTLRHVPATAAAGGSYARNVGVLAARGRFVLVCDQDDVVCPTWVGALRDALASADVLATGPIEAHSLNSAVVAQLFTQDRPYTLVRPFVVQGYLPFVHGCNFALRRSTYLEVGGMDNSYNGGDEDTDFCWRVQESGRPVVCLDGATVAYRLRETPAQIFRQRRAYARGRVLTYVRSLGGPRHLAGMSLRWTLGQAARLPVQWLRSRSSPEARLRFARHAGGILGNLDGQLHFRILRRLPEPETMRDPAFAGPLRASTSTGGGS